MTKVAGRREINSASEMLPFVELRDVAFLRVVAERIIGDPGPDPWVPGAPVNAQIQAGEGHDDEHIEVRCRIEITTDVHYNVEASAFYVLSEPLEPTPEAVKEFVEKVGVMAIYPFLREAIVGLGARLRVQPPILGVLLPQNLNFEVALL